MSALCLVFQLVIPLGIFNVWLLRQARPTQYRGRNASNLKDEFAAYGLPQWAFYLVGGLKLFAAGLLLLGFLFPALVFPGAALIAVLMLGAVVMHAKVSDPALRYVPAALMLFMSIVLLI